MFEEEYERGKFDGVQACIDFIKSLPEAEAEMEAKLLSRKD